MKCYHVRYQIADRVGGILVYAKNRDEALATACREVQKNLAMWTSAARFEVAS